MRKVPARTRVVVLVHHTEWRRSSNTGRLVVGALARADVVLRGSRDARLTPAEPRASPAAASRRLVLFPEDGARTVQPSDAHDGLVLVVPDGSWAQARRAVRREPWCEGAERVSLPVAPSLSSRYRLRTAPHAGELSTFEAVAHALAILEGESLAAPLWPLFDAFVARSLAVRGRRSDVWPQALVADRR